MKISIKREQRQTGLFFAEREKFRSQVKQKKLWMLAAILVIICGATTAQAQALKAADLEKYAKEKYGDKWIDAAKNLAEGLTLDKNESLTY